MQIRGKYILQMCIWVCVEQVELRKSRVLGILRSQGMKPKVASHSLQLNLSYSRSNHRNLKLLSPVRGVNFISTNKAQIFESKKSKINDHVLIQVSSLKKCPKEVLIIVFYEYEYISNSVLSFRHSLLNCWVQHVKNATSSIFSRGSKKKSGWHLVNSTKASITLLFICFLFHPSFNPSLFFFYCSFSLYSAF